MPSSKKIPRGVNIATKLTNFTIATFGSAISSIASGNTSIEEILNAMISGKSEKIPKDFRKRMKDPPSEEEQKIHSVIAGELYAVKALNQLHPGPVPIKEFCLRPGNIDLKSLCN